VVSKKAHSLNLLYGTNTRGVTLYAGVKTLLELIPNEYDKFSVNGTGTYEGSYEYMINDEFGLGLEGSYSKTTAFLTQLSYTVDGKSYKNDFWLDMEFKRVFVRAAYHFSKAEKFDAYAFIGAGYRSKKMTLHSDNALLNLYEVLGGEVSVKIGAPFGVKPGIGLRYFFIRNMALSVEIAGGTPLICGGISFKI
jgi:hypothetical protein